MTPILTRDQIVSVVATGFAAKRRDLQRGVRALESMGYRVLLGEHVHERDGYLAGNDFARLDDLLGSLDRPDIAAIWFARGGYGTTRLLQYLKPKHLRRSRPSLIGYSDLTALFAAALKQTDRRCLYGPVVTELGDPDSFNATSLRAALAGRPQRWRVAQRQFWCAGSAEGRLLGGNLTVLNALAGTPYQPSMKDAVLLLEDVGEPTYRVDRMLTQMRDAGYFRGLRGVLLGSMVAPKRKRFPPDRDLRDVIVECFEPLEIPVVAELPIGHLPDKRTVPLGAPVQLDGAARRLIFDP